jgi:DNA-3-methyladenine glycosylase II
MTWDKKSTAAARRHLTAADPIMRRIIRRVGPFGLKLHRNRFQTLVRSIISQQISTAAAKTIRQRLEDRLLPKRVTAESLLAMDPDSLREVGLSRQKTSYILDLAAKTRDGVVRFGRHRRLSDREIIEQLTQVHGIGEWTAQMFLMFSLGRQDVLAGDDLGIRQAIQRAYELSELPNRKKCDTIGESWRPYASMACWYLWRSLDIDG